MTDRVLMRVVSGSLRGTLAGDGLLAGDTVLTQDAVEAPGATFEYPAWAAGQVVVAGDTPTVVVYDGLLYRCIQGHTTQIDWAPDATPALWIRVWPPDVIPPWVQPYGGSGTYVSGSIVTHNGHTWRNDIPAPTLNVWEPGVYGWTQIA